MSITTIHTSISNLFSGRKNSLIIFAKILIASALLYYLISSVQFSQIISALNEVNIFIVVIVFLLSIINIYLQYAKWKLTCSEVLNEKNRSKIFRSLFYGFSAGIITPLRVGEFFGRGIEFKNKSLFQVTAATLVDKFFPLLIVAYLGALSVLLFIYFYYQVTLYVVISLFILLFTFFYFLFFLFRNKKFWNSIMFSKLNSSARIKSLLEKLRTFENLDSIYFNKMLIISFLFYVCYIMQYALLVSAFTDNNDFVNYLWAANLIMFVKTIIPPISIGELGIREGASIYFLTKMGESASVGFNASILLFVINLLIPALVGAVMFLRKNDN
jgi:uncharacterized protein (TIRG00374 family)